MLVVLTCPYKTKSRSNGATYVHLKIDIKNYVALAKKENGCMCMYTFNTSLAAFQIGHQPCHSFFNRFSNWPRLYPNAQAPVNGQPALQTATTGLPFITVLQSWLIYDIATSLNHHTSLSHPEVKRRLSVMFSSDNDRLVTYLGW